MALLHTMLASIDIYKAGECTRMGYAGLPQLMNPSGTAPARTLAHKLLWLEICHDRIRRLFDQDGTHGMLVLPPSISGVRQTTAQVISMYSSEPGYFPVCSLAMLAAARFLVDYPWLVDLRRLTERDADALPNPHRYLILGDDRSLVKLLPIMTAGCTVLVKVPVMPNGRSDPTRPVFLVSPPAKVHDHLRVSVPVDSPPSLAWLGLANSNFDPGWDQFRGHLAWSRAWYFVLDQNELTSDSGPLNARALLDPKFLPQIRRLASFLLTYIRFDRAVQVLLETPDGHRGYLEGLVIAAPYSPSNDTFIILCIGTNGHRGRSPECDGIIAREAAMYRTRLSRRQHPMPRTTYYTPTSFGCGLKGALVAEVDERFGHRSGRNIDLGNVRVKVEGWPLYPFPF